MTLSDEFIQADIDRIEKRISRINDEIDLLLRIKKNKENRLRALKNLQK